MTVSAQQPIISSVGNGVTTTFPFAFKVAASGDLPVKVGGVLQTYGVNYTITGLGADAGGSIVFTTAPVSGAAVTAIRSTSLARATDYQIDGDFLSDVVNDDQDSPILMLQDLAAQLERYIRVPDTELTADLDLPVASARLGKYMHFSLTTGAVDLVDITASTTILSASVIKSFINRLRLNSAVGNDVANDTTPVANALSGLGPTSIIDLDEGRYATTAADLSKGTQWTGAGFISVNQVVKTPWGRRQPLVWGQENLYAFQNKIFTGAAWRATFTGDSTTAGTSASSPYLLHELFIAAARRRSAAQGTAVNRGQSGQTTATWLSTYLAGDLVPQPHLLVVRWGLNDPLVGPLTVAQTIANLRTGLSTLRAAYGVKDLSILVCTPNSASDSSGGRDERWAEQIIHGYRQAAMDFQCAFIDIYSMFQDSRGGAYGTGNSAAQLWMDDPFADGRAIHPKNLMNTWIISAIAELCFRGCDLYGSTLVQESGGLLTKASTDLPSTYNKGLSLYRALTGFPRNGFVYTQNYTDDGQFQLVFGFGTPKQRSVRTRFGRADVWDPWDGEVIAPTLVNSWVNFGGSSQVAGYTRDMYARVSLQGLIKNGTAAAGTTILTLPVDYRPLQDCWFTVPCNAASGQVKITLNGVVSIEAGNNTYLSLEGINFLAA